MKKTFFTIFIFFLIACGSDKKQPRQIEIPTGKEAKETNYYLIRHAEKRRDNPNEKKPELSDEGFKRSKYWGEYFQDKELDLFFTTDYMRTFQTLIPIVYPYKAEIQFYKAKDTMFTDEFWQKTYGKNTIIVGHSNTTPKFVNQIINENKYESILDSINYRLYKVKVDKDGFIVLDTFVNIIPKP